MKNKLLKKVIGTGLLCFMAMTMMGNVSALANNWQDTPFTFKFANAQLITEVREKQDTSKMYMKCDKITYGTSYTAHAAGYNPSTGRYYDCSRGYTYRFESNTSHYLTNWVYEDNYTYGLIAASPNYAYEFAATGVWSPDNYNQY